MKRSIAFFTVVFFCLIATSVFAQVGCDTAKYSKLLSNSYQCKWNFFKLNDTIEGIMIKHERQTTGCGTLATASLSIINTASDTIRVLSLCNQEEYNIGQKVKIIPSDEPQFQVHIPTHIYIEMVERGNKKNKNRDDQKFVYHSNEFDERILVTTWGEIIPICYSIVGLLYVQIQNIGAITIDSFDLMFNDSTYTFKQVVPGQRSEFIVLPELRTYFPTLTWITVETLFHSNKIMGLGETPIDYDGDRQLMPGCYVINVMVVKEKREWRVSSKIKEI